MSLIGYWMFPITVANGHLTLQTPKPVKGALPPIPANAGIRSYSVLNTHIAAVPGASAASSIDYFLDPGFEPSGAACITQPPGVVQVQAGYTAFGGSASFLFITDMFE
jgi:hypothetical protein